MQFVEYRMKAQSRGVALKHKYCGQRRPCGRVDAFQLVVVPAESFQRSLQCRAHRT